MSQAATVFLGEVDAFDEEAVTTRFLVAGPILVPLGSYYRTAKGDLYQIPLQQRSVRLGWIRTYAGLAAIFFGIGALFSAYATPPRWGLFLLAGAVAALLGYLWFVASVRWGAVSEADATKRAALKEVTGISGFPEMLPEEVARRVFADLERTWKRRHRELGGRRRWQKTVGEEVSEEAGRLLAALATYERAVQGEAPADLACRAWAALGVAEERPPETKPTPTPAPEPASEKRRRRGAVIKLECPHCAHRSRVPHAYAGRRGLCPACKKPIQVPGQLSLSQAPSQAA